MHLYVHVVGYHGTVFRINNFMLFLCSCLRSQKASGESNAATFLFSIA